MNFRMDFKGGDLLAAKLVTKAATADAKVAGVVKLYGAMLAARVRRNASGRPGPNVITGRYRESIGHRVEHTAVGFRAVVFSNAPQSRRLELGFVGTDSAGRTFNQQPFPHFRPAIKEIEAPFVGSLGKVANS